ncbi:MAG: hypothetical protein KIT84_01225 [Labilithrix sp.]|nr:hypothetical protein [Labilithrix sp.]
MSCQAFGVDASGPADGGVSSFDAGVEASLDDAGVVAPDVLDGLIGYWAFDEGSGQTARDGAGASDGEIAGATWTSGRYGGALRFDGVDDLVAIADAPALGATYTIAL